MIETQKIEIKWGIRCPIIHIAERYPITAADRLLEQLQGAKRTVDAIRLQLQISKLLPFIRDDGEKRSLVETQVLLEKDPHALSAASVGRLAAAV